MRELLKFVREKISWVCDQGHKFIEPEVVESEWSGFRYKRCPICNDNVNIREIIE